MTVNFTSFRSIRGLTVWLVRFTIASIVLGTISLAVMTYQNFAFEYDRLLESISRFSENLQTIITIIVVAITLFWYYWASKNIHSFGAKEVTSPKMAMIWWIVPIFFFWKPYDVTQQLWKASDPEINLTEGTEWTNVPDENIITIWWILILAFVFSALILYGLQDYLVDSEQSWGNIEAILFVIMTTLILSAAIIIEIYFIRIVRRISTWQDLKYSSLSGQKSV